MTAIALERCWNHAAREAVCRCPGCARFYCRECVTEHEGRLLCAACVAGVAARPHRRATWLGKLAGPAAAAAGLLIAWLAFYGTARLIAELTDRLEEQQWRRDGALREGRPAEASPQARAARPQARAASPQVRAARRQARDARRQTWEARPKLLEARPQVGEARG